MTEARFIVDSAGNATSPYEDASLHLNDGAERGRQLEEIEGIKRTFQIARAERLKLPMYQRLTQLMHVMRSIQIPDLSPEELETVKAAAGAEDTQELKLPDTPDQGGKRSSDARKIRREKERADVDRQIRVMREAGRGAGDRRSPGGRGPARPL